MLRVKKLSVFVACAALIGLAANGCGRPKEPGRYYNGAEDFSLKLPEPWEIREGTMGAAVIVLSPQSGPSDDFTENVNVVVERLPKSMSAKEYEVATRRMLSTLGDFAPIDEGACDIDGREAVWVVYSHRMKHRMKVLMYVLTRGRKAYVITCTATPETFEEYEPVFREVARSFRFE